MIGPLLVAAWQAYQDAREAAFDAARARVRRYMLANVRCPYCFGTGLDPSGRSDLPCDWCHGTGLRQDHHGS